MEEPPLASSPDRTPLPWRPLGAPVAHPSSLAPPPSVPPGATEDPGPHDFQPSYCTTSDHAAEEAQRPPFPLRHSSSPNPTSRVWKTDALSPSFLSSPRVSLATTEPPPVPRPSASSQYLWTNPLPPPQAADAVAASADPTTDAPGVITAVPPFRRRELPLPWSELTIAGGISEFFKQGTFANLVWEICTKSLYISELIPPDVDDASAHLVADYSDSLKAAQAVSFSWARSTTRAR